MSGQIVRLKFPFRDEFSRQYRGKLFEENIGLLAGQLEHRLIEKERHELSGVIWVSFEHPEPPITALASKIDALFQQQDVTEDDTYRVQALSQETAETAKSLLQQFPPGTSKPAISATAQGELDFDWCSESGAMLTISVGPEGDIAFAFTDGDSEHAGRECSLNDSPDTVRFYLQKILR